MAKDRRSRDQKRKEKLAKKQKKALAPQASPYRGDAYRTKELVPVWLATETGIYEAFVITDSRLTDKMVESAVYGLINQLRSGQVKPFEELEETAYQRGEEDQLVIDRIRSNWLRDFGGQRKPTTDDLIGVLRSTLSTIETMSTGAPQSQAYLRHIVTFLKEKVGISIDKRSVREFGP